MLNFLYVTRWIECWGILFHFVELWRKTNKLISVFFFFIVIVDLQHNSKRNLEVFKKTFFVLWKKGRKAQVGLVTV